MRIQDILEAIARIQKTTEGMNFSDFESGFREVVCGYQRLTRTRPYINISSWEDYAAFSLK
jgi:hypothetical protein